MTASSRSERALSIDVFRGLTVFMMIFVNDLGAKGIPKWMQHAAANEDRMTFVDVVFPSFLFIVGMSIPLARKAREKAGESLLRTHLHALERTLSLLLMGYFLVNRWHFNPEVALVGYNGWTLGAHLCIVLVWSDWGRLFSERPHWGRLAQAIGGLGFVALFYAFSGGDSAHFMGRSWWGILGLIGWAYALSYLLLALFGGDNLLLSVSLLALLGFRIATAQESFTLPSALAWSAEFAGIGVLASMSVVGALVSHRLLLQRDSTKLGKTLLWLFAFGALLLLAGALLRPGLGASKIRATPTWALYSAGFCCWIFALLYYVLDVRQVRGWAKWFAVAGQNPLLLYLLPGIFFTIFGLVGFTVLDDHFGAGGMRILRAAVMSFVFLGVAGWLGKRGLFVKL